jgi:uncharacterized damage-inducible protein DinB
MPETLTSLTELFNRDLNKLKRELELYNNEADLWVLKGNIRNTAGNLAWHLIGNLNHFISNTLGNSGYVRDRHGEFNDKNIPRGELILAIDNAIQFINVILPTLTKAQLQSKYPIEVFGKPMTTIFFLMHLHSHLNYHLGQINYHRRFIDG